MSAPFIASLFSLDGKRALVTGASSGLGHHFALTLAAAGAHVVVAARRVDKLARLVAEIEASGGRAIAAALDVTHSPSVRQCFDVAQSQVGVIDIVINNAGTGVSKPALEQTEADWDSVIDVNLKGAWLVAQEAAKRMVSANIGGSIVNIASILAERVVGGTAPYAASKAGLAHLTKSLALEWARHGIRVNAIAPGYIPTELNREALASEGGERLKIRIPQRRFGEPGDLDGALLLLASNAGAYMTGSVITVDGGHLVGSL